MTFISDLAPLGRVLLTTDTLVVGPTATTEARSVGVGTLLGLFSTSGASPVLPLMDGTASIGVSVAWSLSDHCHPTDTSRAPVNSPTFIGTVTIPAGAQIAGYATVASLTAGIAGYATTASMTAALAAMPIFTATTTAASLVLTAGQARTNFVATAPVTLTLPAAAALANGASFGAICRPGPVIFVPDVAAGIGGGAAGSSFTVPTGTSCLLIRDDTANWSILSLSGTTVGPGDQSYALGLTM